VPVSDASRAGRSKRAEKAVERGERDRFGKGRRMPDPGHGDQFAAERGQGLLGSRSQPYVPAGVGQASAGQCPVIIAVVDDENGWFIWLGESMRFQDA